ncbi:MAG: hypothetical protein QOJ23_2569 [Actinomycetota bacterium]|nr:hypothetical protein [Actinomycetota bacterium]
MQSAPFPLVLGLDTFGDVTHDVDGRPLSHAQTIRNVVEQGVLADEVGVDFFGIGEHHTDDFPMSAADVVLGWGSSIDSFPLFGYDLGDYEQLFEEKTHLFAELLQGGRVTWQGKTRSSLTDQDFVPHTEHGPFPAWLGVGGSPQSVIRAARYGFSLD